MTTAPEEAPSLLRATVASHDRRVDLTLPGAVPVADLLPELARCVGLLDAATAHNGLQLVTGAGRVLAPGVGLVAQEVEDGAVLTVAPGGGVGPRRVYDDVVEAMSDAVEHDLVTWGPEAGGRAVAVALAVVLALGAVALFVGDATVPGVTSAVAAVALVAAAVVLSRVRGERVVALVLAWASAGYAAVGGALATSGELVAVPASAAAGGGSALAGAVALLGVREGRALVLPPVVVGTALLVCGLAGQGPVLDHAEVLMICMVLVVLAGSILPWVALGVTASGADQLRGIADPTSEPVVVDPAEVAADARLAHEVLLALSTSVGSLVALVAPIAASRGLPGTLVGVTCCAVVLLRTRQHRVAAEVVVGLGLGGLALAALLLSVLWHHPGWWGSTAALVGAAATAVLVGHVLPGSLPPWRRARLGDVAETTCLACLPPLLLLATGVVGMVRG